MFLNAEYRLRHIMGGIADMNLKHHDIYPAPKGAPDPAPGRKELWSSDCTIRLRGVLIAYVVIISPKLGSRLAPGRQPGYVKGASSMLPSAARWCDAGSAAMCTFTILVWPQRRLETRQRASSN